MKVKQMGDENYVAWSDRIREEGIEIFIQDNIEEEKTEEQIIEKLVKKYKLSEEKAIEYYDKYSKVSCKTE